MQSMLLRSFIAIEMPPEVQTSIVRSITNLKKALPSPLIRWVASQNLHLTLKFLGDVSPGSLELLTEALQAEVACQTGFMLKVGRIGAFPTPRRARVLWVGIEGPPALNALQHIVENVTARMGYPPEQRPFSPHMTIGRVGQSVSNANLMKVRTALTAAPVGDLGRVYVDALYIFKSDLRPGGSIYTPLYRLPLRS